MAFSPLAFGLGGEALAQVSLGKTGSARPEGMEAKAGGWRTWLASSGRALRPAAPPRPNSARAHAEFQELLNLQAQRADATVALVRFWDAQGGIPVWSQVLLNKVKETKTDPVRTSRALALLHTALADATVGAWNAKFAFRRLQPARSSHRLVSLSAVDKNLPSYPSEHAAVAAAAATVLNALFPGQTAEVHGQQMTFDAIAGEAANSRLWAGACYRSDLAAGFALGEAVGRLAVERAESDGSDAVWDPVAQPGRPLGPQFWVPTPPANAFPPLHPLAATWKPWLLRSGSEFRPGFPPALQGTFPSSPFLQEANEVKQTVDNLTPDQLQIANFWADNPGATFTPPGHWMQIALQHVMAARLSTPAAARALALVAVGVADSGIACWDCKYTYWAVRPITAIRTMADQPFYDPTFLTPVATPPFPSYTSGHSTFSGCSATVLEHLFPGGKVADAFGHSVSFQEAADQAAVSRLYGGIHYRSDNEEGLTCGRKVAGLVIQRARTGRAH